MYKVFVLSDDAVHKEKVYEALVAGGFTRVESMQEATVVLIWAVDPDMPVWMLPLDLDSYTIVWVQSENSQLADLMAVMGVRDVVYKTSSPMPENISNLLINVLQHRGAPSEHRE